MLALHILTARKQLSARRGNSTVYCCSQNGKRNDRIFSDAVSLVLALHILMARATIVLPSQVSGGHLQAKKKPPTFVGGFVLALPIFTASHPATIVGVQVLNFCVRDGNRWTHLTINTNYSI